MMRKEFIALLVGHGKYGLPAFGGSCPIVHISGGPAYLSGSLAIGFLNLVLGRAKWVDGR
jgi:hypothetical protein